MYQLWREPSEELACLLCNVCAKKKNCITRLRLKRKLNGNCIRCNRPSEKIVCYGCYTKNYNRLKERMKDWAFRKTIFSRQGDTKKARPWNEAEYITAEFLREMRRKQVNSCCYCLTPMQTFNMRAMDGLTVQRLDNSLAHIRTNCVLCCYKCNVSRMEYRSPEYHTLLKNLHKRKIKWKEF